MEMTIKEKMRIAWERDLEVVVMVATDNPLCGKIQHLASCGNTRMAVVDEFGKSAFVMLRDITDIRFVDEEQRVRNEATQKFFDKIAYWNKILEELDTPSEMSADEPEKREMKIHIVDELEECQDEPVAVGQFAYMEPGADRKVVGLICDSALVNSEGKLVVHTHWPGEHHIAGIAGQLDMDFARSIFGYHGGAIVYEVLICGGYADITFTIGDPQESREEAQGNGPNIKNHLTARHKEIMELKAELAELKRSLSEPVTHDEPEQHDIASERWEWVKVGTAEGLAQRDDSCFIDTDQKKALRAAAPELADMMREGVRRGVWDGEGMRKDMVKRIKFLRKLGVPNVAPWYKDEDEEPVYNFIGVGVPTPGSD